MPLYSLTCLAIHYPTYAPLRTLVHTAATLVREGGGVVRNIEYMGRRNTPQRIKAPGVVPGGVTEADYWTMRFDANPPTIKTLDERLRVDPRVLRHTTLKVASTRKLIAETRWAETMKPALPLTEEDKRHAHEEALDREAGKQFATRP